MKRRGVVEGSAMAVVIGLQAEGQRKGGPRKEITGREKRGKKERRRNPVGSEKKRKGNGKSGSLARFKINVKRRRLIY